jgi:hypothetical protein
MLFSFAEQEVFDSIDAATVKLVKIEPEEIKLENGKSLVLKLSFFLNISLLLSL